MCCGESETSQLGICRVNHDASHRHMHVMQDPLPRLQMYRPSKTTEELLIGISMHGQCRSGLEIDYQRSRRPCASGNKCPVGDMGLELRPALRAVCLNQTERQRQAYLPDPGALRGGTGIPVPYQQSMAAG